MRWLLKRWWFWGVTGFMLFAVCAGYLLIPVGEGRISQTSCNKIQLGTGLDQVAELLGSGWSFEQCHNDEIEHVRWIDEDGNVLVVWVKNVSGSMPRVTAKQFIPSKLSELMKRRIERRLKALWP